MNILFLHRSFPAQFKYLASELAKDKNNTVTFVTNSKTFEIDGIKKYIYEPDTSGLNTSNPILKGLTDAIAHGKGCAKTLLKLKQNGFSPDIIYGHSGWGVTMFVKELFPQTPLICYFEWFQTETGADFGYLKPLSEYQKIGLKYANTQILKDLEICDGGISPTEWQKSRFPKEFQNKIKVIYDGTDTLFFKPDNNAEFILKDSNTKLTKSDNIITYATRGMEPYRGFPQFMEAITEVLQKTDANIIIAGEDKVFYSGEQQSYKELMLDKFKLRNNPRIHFTGALTYEEYLKLLQVSTAHVYLTVPYVLSWSLMEALSCGCCVIASSTQPINEVIKNNKNGLLFDFFNTKEQAEKIIYAINNKDKLNNMRENARLSIIKNYAVKKSLKAQIN